MTAIGSVPSAAAQSSSIEVARLAQDQQRADGRAAVSLIQGAGEVQGGAGRAATPPAPVATSSAAAPPTPSPDGTGRAVDVLA